MKRIITFAGAVGLGLGVVGAASAALVYPVNDGFETPDLSVGAGSQGNSYGYANQGGGNGPFNTAAAGIGWKFTGNGVGIAANGSGFGVANATNLNNNPGAGNATSTYGQAALLQGGDGSLTSNISQSITLPVGTTKATLLFDDEGRKSASGYGNDNGIVVYVDGNLIPGGGTVAAPLFPVAGSNTFDPETIVLPATVGAGAHTFQFVGDNTLGGDATSFFDNVKVLVTTPEPASISLLGFGALGLLARRRRA